MPNHLLPTLKLARHPRTADTVAVVNVHIGELRRKVPQLHPAGFGLVELTGQVVDLLGCQAGHALLCGKERVDVAVLVVVNLLAYVNLYRDTKVALRHKRGHVCVGGLGNGVAGALLGGGATPLAV